MLIAVAAQAFIDSFASNGTFGATVVLAGLATSFRLVLYIGESLGLIAKARLGKWFGVIVITAILCSATWFLPDAILYLVRLSGR
jgi:hypothetical protein